MTSGAVITAAGTVAARGSHRDDHFSAWVKQYNRNPRNLADNLFGFPEWAVQTKDHYCKASFSLLCLQEAGKRHTADQAGEAMTKAGVLKSLAAPALRPLSLLTVHTHAPTTEVISTAETGEITTTAAHIDELADDFTV